MQIRTENNDVPALRFPPFEGVWKEDKLGKLTKIYDGTHQTPKYVEQGVPFYSVEHLTKGDFTSTKFISEAVYDKECRKVKLEQGDILMTRIGDVGTSKYISWDVRASFYVSLALIKQSKRFDSRFLDQSIKSTSFQRELHKRTIHVAFPRKINLGEIGKCGVKLPSLPEQQKIAAFLTTIDTRIQQLARKVALLEQYKKGVMQQLFTQAIRFKPDSHPGSEEQGRDFPDWEEVKLGEVVERVTRKNKEDNQNVLTISAQQGLVNQEEYFNKSVAAKDVTGYYLLHQGEFAYNKSYSKGYPLGAIKRLTSYSKGVVSTLYICFKAKRTVSEEYLEQYFESGGLNREIHKIAQEGARNHGLLNVSVVEFFKDITLFIPSLAEQRKIAVFLSAVDKRLQQAQQQLDHTQTFKRGLLQQMFV